MGNVKADLKGRKFGNLTAIEYVGVSKSGHRLWRCVCDCGKEIVARGTSMTSGTKKSCGCLYRATRRSKVTHGSSHTRLYRIWDGMVQRCTNPNSSKYANYGGRGIGICEEWRNDFSSFRDWAMANGYDPEAPRGKCTIDRIDVNEGYSPSNCRFVDMSAQQSNKRPYRIPGQFKPVELIDESGRVVDRYESILDASVATGCSRSGVSMVCHGRQETTHGMRWRFESNVDA